MKTIIQKILYISAIAATWVLVDAFVIRIQEHAEKVILRMEASDQGVIDPTIENSSSMMACM